MPIKYGSNAEYPVFESSFSFDKPPQSKSDGSGGAPEASERMISHSFQPTFLQLSLIEPKFDSAYGFEDGLANVMINDKWGFIDQSGKFVIEPIYDWTNLSFSDGTVSVGIGDDEFQVDKQGNIVED